MTEHDIAVVLTTTPDDTQAATLATLLVEQQLAACVQRMPVRSVYHWEGAVQDEPEVLLLIKTRASCFAELEAFIRQHHSYTVPEILLLPVGGVSSAYLAWLAGLVRPGTTGLE